MLCDARCAVSLGNMSWALCWALCWALVGHWLGTGWALWIPWERNTIMREGHCDTVGRRNPRPTPAVHFRSACCTPDWRPASCGERDWPPAVLAGCSRMRRCSAGRQGTSKQGRRLESNALKLVDLLLTERMLQVKQRTTVPGQAVIGCPPSPPVQC